MPRISVNCRSASTVSRAGTVPYPLTGSAPAYSLQKRQAVPPRLSSGGGKCFLALADRGFDSDTCGGAVRRLAHRAAQGQVPATFPKGFGIAQPDRAVPGARQRGLCRRHELNNFRLVAARALSSFGALYHTSVIARLPPA